jgi:hypothetical protein
VLGRLDVFMWDFDLRELNGDDLRRDPLNVGARQRARASGAGLATHAGWHVP